MIYAKPTENLTGICLEGEYLDFYEIVESIYRMTGLEDDYYDPYWGVKNRLMGMCYDIRHAYQGDREVTFVDNGVNDALEKWHEMIMPKENVHYKVNILFPEAVFVALSVSDLYIFSKKYYDNERVNVEHREDVYLCDFIKDKGNLEMLSCTILDALGRVIGDDGFRQILKEIERKDLSWEAPFYRYITSYVDRCNIEYLKTVPEKRKDKLRNIAKRFVKQPQTYLNLKRDFEYSAKQQNCSIYHLYDPKSDKYPEDIEW